MSRPDEPFGRRRERQDGAKQHAEPTLSFTPKTRDSEPRGPRLSTTDTRSRGTHEAPSLMGDADRPLYMEHEAESERSSRVWIGIAAFAVIAGLSGYGWHLYTMPATVEPFPVQNPTRDLAATPDTTTAPPSQAAAQSPATPSPAVPPPAQSLSTVGQVATPSASNPPPADSAASTPDAAIAPFTINSPAAAARATPPAKPDVPRADLPAPRKEAALDVTTPPTPKSVPKADQTPRSLPPVKLTPPAPVALTPPAPPAPEPSVATTVPRPPVASPTTIEPPATNPITNGPVATGRPLPLSPASLPVDRDVAAPVLRQPSAPTTATLSPPQPANYDALPLPAPATATSAPNAAPNANAPNTVPGANAPNTVTVDGVTYVSGQEPHALGTLSSAQPPAASDAPTPLAAPSPAAPQNTATPYAPPSDAAAPLPNDVIIAPNGQMSVPSSQ